MTEVMKMLRWLRKHDILLEKFTDARECKDCVRVSVWSTRLPIEYSCDLDDTFVKGSGHCEAFFDWYRVADEDLPTSSHEKAALLALKLSTYRRENYTCQKDSSSSKM